MKIEIVVLPEAGATPEAPSTYALGVVLLLQAGDEHSPAASELHQTHILQRGYSTPNHALAALVDCLTFAPPDMAPLEEGLSHVSSLLDRMNDVEGAITQLGDRMNGAEDALTAMQSPQPAVPNRLLAPRPGATAAAVRRSHEPPVAAPAPGPIRRAPQQVVMTAGHGAGGSISGRPKMAITGGPGRPGGHLGPTGVDTDDEGV